MTTRPFTAADPLRFGRRARLQAVARPAGRSAGDDVRLFATTFAAGFVFVAVLVI